MTGTVEIHEALAKAGLRRVTIEATVTRADGTVEPLGIIADSRKPSILKRIGAKLWRTR